MKTEVKKWLLDARNSCVVIAGFIGSHTLETYDNNLMLRSAVERQLEIIGEALNKAQSNDPALGDQVPDVRLIIGLRNRIIHGYDTVDNQIAWDIVKTELPRLTQQLDALLG